MRPRRLLLSSMAAVLLAFSAACQEERGGVEVRDLSFTGVDAIAEGQLESVLATGESSRLPWGTKRYFSREQFEADLKRIEAFYADRGFPNARVKAFDVNLNEDQTSVRIRIDVVEGEPLRVERVIFEGFDPVPDEHERELERRLPLRSGEPLDRALLQASRETALDELRDHGHPYATVRVTEGPGATEHSRVVTLRGDPGPLTHFGAVEISGNQSLGDRVVQRQLTFRPGEVYRQTRLRESQRRLYGLELFDFVNVEPLGTDERASEIRTRVTVVEGKHRRVNFGGGYGTEERIRGQVDWRHVNFFGGARTAGVFARYSALDQGVRLNFQQPYFFSPRYALGLSGQSWYANEPAYELNTTGGRLTITRQFARAGGPLLRRQPTTSATLTYANEWEDYVIKSEALDEALKDLSNPESIDRALRFRNDLIALGLDPRTGTGRGQRSALMLDLGRNTTENLLDARSGYVATLHAEQAGRWLQGDFSYYELSAEGRYYQALGNIAVVAVRARAGTIDTFGEQEEPVPFFKRYFLGGATNLRGWGRFEVAPLSGAGLPIGGHSFLNFSTEVRVPVWGSLGGVLFLDGGNVWADPWGFDLGDMRYNVGPGLRYNTPVGPVRFDIGYQLNPIPGLLMEQPRRYRLHFSIGHAF